MITPIPVLGQRAIAGGELGVVTEFGNSWPMEYIAVRSLTTNVVKRYDPKSVLLEDLSHFVKTTTIKPL